MLTKSKKAKKATRSKIVKAGKRAKAASATKTAPKAAPKKRAKKKAAPGKSVRVKARTPKATARGAAPKRAKARAKPLLRREDHPGHLDPKYAAALRRQSGRPEPEPESFLDQPRSKDDLVEELGEEFVGEVTSGEHEGEDLQDQLVPEERGGPFVETPAGTEFAQGTDPSNPKGATREPFPRT